MSVANIISSGLMPAVVMIVVIYGVYKKTPLLDIFSEGAKNGLMTVFNILPVLIALMCASSVFVKSGMAGIFQTAVKPITDIIHFSLGTCASFINKNVFLLCSYGTYNGDLQILRSRFVYRQNRFRNACLYGNCILYNECIFFFRKHKKHTIHSFLLPFFRSLRNCRQCSHNLFYVVLDLIGKIILY